MTVALAERPPVAEPRPTPRQLLSAWYSEQIENRPGVDIATLHREAIKRFRNDDEFINALIRDSLRDLSWQELRAAIHRTRTKAQDAPNRNAEAVERSVVGFLSRWYESVGPRDYKPLFQLRRPELIECARHRRARAEGELRVASFEDALAGGLPNDETTVRDHYTDEQLEQIFNAHIEKEAR